MSAILPIAEIEPDHRGSLAAHAHKDWLRFITCGSVDDGKSTLIGRLLIETGAVYSDQLLALRRDTSKHGTTGEALDPALLVDGLEDERQQGITIDVAYRYFSTPRRKFMIADTPGHEQFTRNMATGASQADVALILVDASQGLLTQTRRHAFIVSLLGIQQVILVVNKMDLVNYQAPVFQRIAAEFCGFAEQLKLTRIHCLPLSALKGDNLVQPSPLMPWYEGLPLLGLLESVEVQETASHDALRFPVQWVNRPSADFRGFSGSLVSGSIRVGDEVLVQPSNLRTRVRGILNGTSYCNQATAPQSVTLTLTDEIDVTRGDMLVAVDQPPQVSRSAAAMVLWMSEQPLATERSYWVKQSTKRTSGVVSHIHYGLNVNTLERFATTTLQLNDIALCELKFHDPLVFDAYRQNRHTGSFILVDRLTHETVAAGMLVTRQSEDGGADYWFAEPISGQLREAVSRITSLQRQRCYGHPPFTILLTGLSGSGKTSLALALEERLFSAGLKCLLLDGQNLRLGISRDLGFTAAERSENLRRAAEIARLANQSGLVCIAAFVAPHADIRQRARELIGLDKLVHIHLSAPLEICRQRDSSGRYAAAERGEIADFPGITHPYIDPEDADLILPTDRIDLESAQERVLDLLHLRQLLDITA